ncbi:MAG: N-acetylmuramoyl-L-alanine amidase [Lactobacillales bacterium]|jgi:N-acetylmuramoyl-L-alanine amidase|nr:N-acetylmuramoyl-L-alanine amidase [Lactobacillales bacterium]
MKLWTFLLSIFFFSLWGAHTAVSGEVQNIRLSQYQPKTVRMVIDLSDKVDASVFRLSNPSRLVIDLKKTSFSKQVRQKPLPTAGFISGVRLGNPSADIARVVLDLPQISLTESHFLLPPQGGNAHWRFVMDISSDIDMDNKMVNITPPPEIEKPTLKPFDPKTKKVVMLDPGHGGVDPGAVSRNGNYEKDLTLKMAKEAKTLLEKEGYKVVLTRDRDVAVSLRGRIEKAHAANADLFISIHADSALNKNARGLSVYTISETASDKEAAALAERENKSDIILGMDLTGYQPEVGNILIDLAKREMMDKSAIYATYLVREMKKAVKLVPNAHRFAGFVVLKSPNIPSVLLEMGYLSNKEEERLLQKKSYREDLAKALVVAVNNYFKEVD